MQHASLTGREASTNHHSGAWPACKSRSIPDPRCSSTRLSALVTNPTENRCFNLLKCLQSHTPSPSFRKKKSLVLTQQGGQEHEAQSLHDDGMYNCWSNREAGLPLFSSPVFGVNDCVLQLSELSGGRRRSTARVHCASSMIHPCESAQRKESVAVEGFHALRTDFVRQPGSQHGTFQQGNLHGRCHALWARRGLAGTMRKQGGVAAPFPRMNMQAPSSCGGECVQG